ncbi:MAG: preprotein translocase subunit SecA [Chloroflexi bacterium]|nr:preprotein translocase subunit SecA [Chloroflexota bacterium]
MAFITKLFGDPNEKEVKKLRPTVDKINALEPEMEAASDEDLQLRTAAFKERLAEADPDDHQDILDEILPEAFAMVREAARRTIGQRHYDVQLIGGIVLHQGKIAEMKTGEGKTLVATLPTYLNALTGRGVHVITVNDYLARRDAQWMGRIYDKLGLTVGVLQHDTAYLYSPEHVSSVPNMERLAGPFPRKQVYEADIVYGTNHEFGFDYLRDNMATSMQYTVQRDRYYAIVDEVDNILIDEARTPLIISGPAEENTRLYQIFAAIVPQLRPEEDYTVDLKARSVQLTEVGVEKVEMALKRIPNLLQGDSIYAAENYRLTRFLEASLKANVIYQRDRDYVVKDGEVVIVDDFTGRLMQGRRWSDGLHQAVEAKERVKVQQESITYATITLQNYFRLYEKLAGMTGTAATEAEEFHKIYKLEVVTIPTHRDMVREDANDLIYRSEPGKYNAVIEEVAERHARGQPVLVGTVSIEKSEYLAEMLKRRGIPHHVLNAKQHEREAFIVAEAGHLGAVTIATNMAGRGTDILLGGNPDNRYRDLCHKAGLDPETGDPDKLARLRDQAKAEWQEEHDKVLEAGGLHIIGTERHESRRIDNQLRGRAGRQGDPGSSRFYVSFEDDLMKRFAPEWLPGMMTKLGMDDDTPIEQRMVTKAIQTAQVKVEGHNFDIRKHVVEYDDVMNLHRDKIYGDRHKLLTGADLKSNILEMVDAEILGLVQTYCSDRAAELWDIESLFSEINADGSGKGILPLPKELSIDALSQLGRDEIEDRLLNFVHAEYDRKEAEMGIDASTGEPRMRLVERLVFLKIIDDLWVQHLTEMEAMREGIGLQAYGQIDPLVAYKREAFDMFDQLQINIRNAITHAIFSVQLREAPPQPPPMIVDMSKARTNIDESDGAPIEPGARSGNGGGVATARRVSAAAMQKVGRNDPCPCGSGKKYKKCHGIVAV